MHRCSSIIPSALIVVVAAALAAPACTPADEGPSCADPAERVVLPGPAWLVDGALAPPEGDAARALLELRRPEWLAALDGLRGWPARPTIVVPLDGVAGSVDPERVVVYVDGAGGLERAETPVSASLVDDGQALLIVPEDPFPPGSQEVVVALEEGAVDGADPLPACGADGRPDPAYDEALGALEGSSGVQLALPVPVSPEPEALPALGERLAESPVLTVVSAEARALDSFGGRSPDEETVALLAPVAVAGILELPDYRDEAGRFHLGEDGAPEPQGTTRPGFVVALPATVEPPYPFVLFQHGGSQDKADLFGLAGPLAAAGFAFVAIDLPSHGDRASEGTGAGDLDILDFEDPIRSRDNLRQASADHLAVLTGLEALNAAVEEALSVAEALDPDRAFYMGLSLGGITGSMTFASAPRLRGAALFVGGGGYQELLSDGLFSLLLLDVLDAPDLERETVLGLLEAALDGADPIAYGQRVERRDEPPRPALFMQAVSDPIVAAGASDRWARAFGADLALPSDHAVAGMQELALPASDNFGWPEGGEVATRLLVQAPMEGVPTGARHGGLIVEPYSQELVAHCFQSVLETGSCEVVDTGFAP